MASLDFAQSTHAKKRAKWLEKHVLAQIKVANHHAPFRVLASFGDAQPSV